MDYLESQDDSGIGEDHSTPSSLHPDKYDHAHIDKLEDFSQDLQKAISNSFPRPKTRYTAVHVLLLRWAEDDLNVQKELTALKDVFEVQFKFATEQWDIPSQSPTRALQSKLYNFQNVHQSEDELLIVYYGGHGDADRRRGRSIWAANKQPDSPTLTWSSLQHLLETAVPHVLIILDCCYAANAARDTSEGTTKELLAACGRENPTLGVGIRSFTSALIEELQAFGKRPFTAAMLHSRLITMRWRLAFTPVYALLSEHGGHSIQLAPLAPEASEIDHDMMEICPAPEAKVADTRVLLTVSIADDATYDIAKWAQWLVSEAPWDVTKIDVKVEAVFRSHSTMLMASLPIAAWDNLPNREAYRFVGFVKSANLSENPWWRLIDRKPTVSKHVQITKPHHKNPHHSAISDVKSGGIDTRTLSNERIPGASNISESAHPIKSEENILRRDQKQPTTVPATSPLDSSPKPSLRKPWRVLQRLASTKASEPKLREHASSKPGELHWYCGWCKGGPMADMIHNRCVFCKRTKDGYATHASSVVLGKENREIRH